MFVEQVLRLKFFDDPFDVGSLQKQPSIIVRLHCCANGAKKRQRVGNMFDGVARNYKERTSRRRVNTTRSKIAAVDRHSIQFNAVNAAPCRVETRERVEGSLAGK